MAAPTIGSTTNALFSADPWSVSVPSHSTGDLLIVFLHTENTRTIDSVPSGWTEITSEQTDSNTKSWAYYRVAGASEPSTYDWGWSLSSDGIALALAISGAEDPASDSIESATDTALAASGLATSPAVTPSTADSLVLRHIASNRNTTFTVPSGETLAVGNLSAGTASAVSYFTHGTSSTGTNDWTTSPTWHGPFVHIVLAIAPTAGGATGSPWYYYAQL